MSYGKNQFHRSDGIYLNASEYDKKFIRFMCESIYKICQEYIEYIYDNCVKKPDSVPSEYEFYKEVLKPKRDLADKNKYDMYTYADRNYISYYLNQIYVHTSNTGTLFNASFNHWSKKEFVNSVISNIRCIQELISQKSDINCTFIYYARNKNDISRSNRKMSFKIPMIGREIPMAQKFPDPPLGRNKPTYFVIRVMTTSNEKKVFCCVQTIYGSKKNPYADEDGFIILKKKGDKNNAYKKYLKG